MDRRKGYHKYSMLDSALSFVCFTDATIVEASERAEACDRLSDEGYIVSALGAISNDLDFGNLSGMK
jgi:hypothetical protein